ncbi:MAG: transaldolase family protein, partial [Candidatus Omnitrophota bacterium]
MKKAGVRDYEGFVRQVLPLIGEKPISFEVIGDDFETMKRQASKLADYGSNVYVKIPVVNTKGQSTAPLIGELTAAGVRVNVTAILTLDQVRAVAKVLRADVPSVVSVFAGRIADTGIDPVAAMTSAADTLKSNAAAELLWASSREVLNIYQAQACGCKIITVTPDILKKMNMIGKDLTELSLETVQMFFNDAVSSGLGL